MPQMDTKWSIRLPFNGVPQILDSLQHEGDWVVANEGNIIVIPFVCTRWFPGGRQYYEARGYKFTQYLEWFVACTYHLPQNSNTIVTVCCPDCGKERKIPVYNISRAGHTRCKSCVTRERSVKDISGQRFGRLLVLKEAGIGKYQRVQWECLCDCGKTKVCSGHYLRMGDIKSCGCLLEEQVGENHPSWNPELTDEHRNDTRNWLEITRWVTRIKERDNYTCVVCGESKKYMAAHHLNSYTAYPEMRTDDKNGVCLCRDCHISFHSYNGGPGVYCTVKDFNGWLHHIGSSLSY